MSNRGLIGTIISGVVMAAAGVAAFAAGRGTKTKDYDEIEVDRELYALEWGTEENEEKDETEE